MSAHRWRERSRGLRVCVVCGLEERTIRRGRPPLYSRQLGTGLPWPPDYGAGPCPGPPRSPAIILPPRLARDLVEGGIRVARMPMRCTRPISGRVADVAATAAGPPVGRVRVGEVRHELLGWILWPTYEYPRDPAHAGYRDPEAYIAEHAEAWGVTPDDAATTWVWRISVAPYREEEATCAAS